MTKDEKDSLDEFQKQISLMRTNLWFLRNREQNANSFAPKKGEEEKKDRAREAIASLDDAIDLLQAANVALAKAEAGL